MYPRGLSASVIQHYRRSVGKQNAYVRLSESIFGVCVAIYGSMANASSNLSPAGTNDTELKLCKRLKAPDARSNSPR